MTPIGRFRLAAATSLALLCTLGALIPPLYALRARALRPPAKHAGAAYPEMLAAPARASAPLATRYDDQGRTRRRYVPEGGVLGSPEERARALLAREAGAFGGAGSPPELVLVAVRTSPSGPHVRLQQHHRGIPIWGAEAVVSFDAALVPTLLASDLVHLEDADMVARIGGEAALDAARRAVGCAPEGTSAALYLRVFGLEPRLVYRVAWACDDPSGDWEVWVDAHTAAVVDVGDRTVWAPAPSVQGWGRVFLPDPVCATGDRSLQDGNDGDAAVPENAYAVVPLRDLDPPVRGWVRLAGPHARLEDWESPRGAPDSSATGDFLRTRSQQGFEDVMVYYHMDAMQRWYQSLGFGDANRRPQVADAHGLHGQDNSKFVPSLHKIAFGEGGVDDAEDAAVIVHEYGHATQHDIVPTWGTGGHTGAMGEGFGDYLANSYAWSLFPERVQAWNGVFFWDGHNAYWPGRRAIDTQLRYPQGAVGPVHRAGTLWCSALTEALYALGDRAVMDRLVLDHHYALTGSATMEDAANAILVADLALHAGVHVPLLVEVFGRWGLVDASQWTPVVVEHTPLDDVARGGVGPRLEARVLSSRAPVADVVAHVRASGAVFVPVPLAPTGEGRYAASLPAPGADAAFEYYLEARDALGNTTRTPAAGRAAPLSFRIATFVDAFESDGGWLAGVPGDDAIAGRWVRAVPTGTVAQPASDHTHAGKVCFVTGNAEPGAPASEADVDGGRTTLLSPVWDLAGVARARLLYWRWYSNDQGTFPNEDEWRVEASGDGGATWVVLESTRQSQPQWRPREFDLHALLPSLASLRLRFVASDTGGPSLVEAAVDDVTILLEHASETPAVAEVATTRFLPAGNPGAVARLRFALAAAGAARLAIYDARGRHVRTLHAGALPAGVHAVVWDGLDARGRRAPRGIYLAALVTASGTVSRKVALLGP